MSEQYATDSIHLAAFPAGTVFVGDDGSIIELDQYQPTFHSHLEPAVWIMGIGDPTPLAKIPGWMFPMRVILEEKDRWDA